jgi:kynureninase
MIDKEIAKSLYDYAIIQDQQDPLAQFRHSFYNLEPDLIYLDGNSLGKLPKAAIDLSEELVKNQWGNRLIRSWNENWIDLPHLLGKKISTLVGACPDEIVVTDSTSVNLFKLIVAALNNQPGKNKILTDDINFPTDIYILQGIIKMLGDQHKIVVAQSSFENCNPEEVIIESIDDNTALIILSHVVFKSGYRYDMEKITKAAHQCGALILWDLSHSTGAINVNLNKCNVDMAVGCTYKYLNGGPGSPAFLYVRKDLQDEIQSPIWGWFGEKNPFDFNLVYQPAIGMNQFLVGTPPVISMAMILPGIDMVIEAGISSLEKKSKLLSDYFIKLFDLELVRFDFKLGSPRNPNKRGSHVSIQHPDAYAISQILIEKYHTIPDFRKPDNIRIGISPLYISFMDIYTTVQFLKSIMLENEFHNFSSKNSKVT